MYAAAAIDGEFLSGPMPTLERALVPARARARLLGAAIILQRAPSALLVAAEVTPDGACQLAIPFPPRLIWACPQAPTQPEPTASPAWIRPGAQQLALFPETT